MLYPDIEANYILNNNSNKEFESLLKFKPLQKIKCDNCNCKSQDIQILHQLKWSNIPETYYFCQSCCSKVLGSNTEINSSLYNCLLWLSQNTYQYPL